MSCDELERVGRAGSHCEQQASSALPNKPRDTSAVTAEEVGVFTRQTKAHNPLQIVLKTNDKKT